MSDIAGKESANSPLAPAATAADVPCVGDGNSGDRVQVIYAHAADVPDRYDQIRPLVDGWAADMARDVSDSAAETGGFRTIRFVTSGCRLVVPDVTLSARGDDDIGRTAADLAAQGYDRSDRKYVVLVDANVYCGVAFLSGNVARVDQGCFGYAELHELVHTLGGVMPDAPNGTRGYHCTDESDRMCYSDSPDYPEMRQVCPTSHERLLDCNHDDYFSTAPQGGGFLARHPEANTADSPFLAERDGETPTFLPEPPAGYTGPRYRVHIYNVDDTLCARGVRATTGTSVRLFCVDYFGDREVDVTGALVSLAQGHDTTILRLIATNHGGGYTYGFTVTQDGRVILGARDGDTGSVSSTAPESTPDPATGWTTFYDRALTLNVADPAPPPPSPGGSSSNSSGGADFGGSRGGGLTVNPGPSATCGQAWRDLAAARARLARLSLQLRRDRARLRSLALSARRSRAARRAYNRRLRLYRSQLRTRRQLLSRIGNLQDQVFECDDSWLAG